MKTINMAVTRNPFKKQNMFSEPSPPGENRAKRLGDFETISVNTSRIIPTLTQVFTLPTLKQREKRYTKRVRMILFLS